MRTTRADTYGVHDVPYVRAFWPTLAPAWLDHVALLGGYAPPPRDQGFAWCDLGCGQGITTVILAATHPLGRFVGIDANAAHTDAARQFAGDAGAHRAQFRTATFETAGEPSDRFNYIVLHGVYSWVDAGAQADIRSFIDRHLAPGGIVHVSYNAMPGRAPDLPLHKLLQEIGRIAPGGSQARMEASLAMARAVAGAGARSLAGGLLGDMADNPAAFPAAYLPHEFMVTAWQPFWVTDLRRTMAEIGLVPAGSATLAENHDAFVLGRRARDLLATVADDDLRELTRDLFLHQRFRRDVFVRGAPAIDDDERRRRLMASSFMLTRPRSLVDYAATTPAGRLSFANPAARALVAALADGPKTLQQVATATATDPRDILANALALTVNDTLRPVEPTTNPVAAVNDVIRARHGTAEAIACTAVSCGTALTVDGDSLAALTDCGTRSDATETWRRFFHAQIR